MSEPVLASTAPPPTSDRSPAAPLFLWLLIQLIALSLAGFRVPLSARFPPPGEQYAIHTMLVAQVVAAAMLFPFLLRDVKSSAMVILTIAPFVQLASYFSSVPVTRAALAALHVATWLTTLALWRATLRTRYSQILGVACAVALSMGGTLIWYARAESREAGVIDWSGDALFGPILGAIAQVNAPSVAASSWFAASALLIFSAVACFAIRAARHHSVGRSGNPSAAP
jgi:FtsH-binding integral membrane protein